MTRVCSVCDHKKVKEINRQLVSGRRPSSISREYGLNKDSVFRHFHQHLSRQLATGAELSLRNYGVEVMDELTDLVDRTKRILEEAEQAGHKKIALSAIQQLRGNLTLISQIQFTIAQEQLRHQETLYQEDQSLTDQDIQERISQNLTPEESDLYFQLLCKILGDGPTQEENRQGSPSKPHQNPEDPFQGGRVRTK